ncbi:hypothetical protein DKX38_015952 [Salix brachista]|uniref:Uncharacterized protein n=1 Tax=Salix brachista TaxID=2182728 RepID=A0A5N5L6P2_9ROSI|nr:hypothetical protein DKX38_015952 [Salix brachista]
MQLRNPMVLMKFKVDTLESERSGKRHVSFMAWISMCVTAASFLWEDFGRPRLLECFVEGTDSLKSLKYNIDERLDHHPIHSGGNPATALRVKIVKKGKMNAVRISDLMPKNDPSLITGRRVQPPSPQLSGCLSTT